MTSLSRECGREVTLGEVKKELPGQLAEIFGREFIPSTKDHRDVVMS
jgi:hypothetical protein